MRQLNRPLGSQRSLRCDNEAEQHLRIPELLGGPVINVFPVFPKGFCRELGNIVVIMMIAQSPLV